MSIAKRAEKRAGKMAGFGILRESAMENDLMTKHD
jgi:hypothetical protein